MGKQLTHRAPAQEKVIEFGLDKIVDLYGSQLMSMQAIADGIGVSCSLLSRTLRKFPQHSARARELRAQVLHEYSISQLLVEPNRIIDAAGNSRIDPASVASIKHRVEWAARTAGILDRRLSDRRQVNVTHAVSPLSDYIGRIVAAGSNIPIASPDAVDGECIEISN